MKPSIDCRLHLLLIDSHQRLIEQQTSSNRAACTTGQLCCALFQGCAESDGGSVLMLHPLASSTLGHPALCFIQPAQASNYRTSCSNVCEHVLVVHPAVMPALLPSRRQLRSQLRSQSSRRKYAAPKHAWGSRRTKGGSKYGSRACARAALSRYQTSSSPSHRATAASSIAP